MANILTVDGSTHKLTVMADGALYGTFPVSLGAAKTPTMLGTNVISEKDRNERMVGSGYDEVVPFSMRITASGEYLHAAAWNVANIGKNNTSNGCTNLLPADAEKLWNYLQIGDPVTIHQYRQQPGHAALRRLRRLERGRGQPGSAAASSAPPADRLSARPAGTD